MDNLYGELERVFDQFSKYHVKMMIWDISAKVEGEDICKLAM
jgi:hypothetical protein